MYQWLELKVLEGERLIKRWSLRLGRDMNREKSEHFMNCQRHRSSGRLTGLGLLDDNVARFLISAVNYEPPKLRL